MKNKWLAAFLNIVPGLGYLYVGTRTPFALMLLGFWPVVIISSFLAAPLSEAEMQSVPMGFWDFAPFLMISLAFIVDAFNEATLLGKQNKKSKD